MQWGINQVISLLAGPAATRRLALETGHASSTSSYHRAVHEAGHVIAARAIGWTCGAVNIHVRQDLLIRGRGHRGGIAYVGPPLKDGTAAPPPPAPEIQSPPTNAAERRARENLNDLGWAVALVSLMAQPRTWRTMLREARQLRAIARNLIDDRWGEVTHLATKLVEERELTYAQIEETMRSLYDSAAA